jgi:hypothetical protein
MINVALPIFVIGLLFYLQESSDENPSLFRAGIYLTSVIQATLCMAFRA